MLPADPAAAIDEVAAALEFVGSFPFATARSRAMLMKMARREPRLVYVLLGAEPQPADRVPRRAPNPAPILAPLVRTQPREPRSSPSLNVGEPEAAEAAECGPLTAARADHLVVTGDDAEADVLGQLGIECVARDSAAMPSSVRGCRVLLWGAAAHDRFAQHCYALGADEVCLLPVPPLYADLFDMLRVGPMPATGPTEEDLEFRRMRWQLETENARQVPAPAQRSAIARLWGTWAPGALSRQPKPRRWLLRHPTRNGRSVAVGLGDGMLLRGIAGLLTASGGSGKTAAAVALAVALITGRRWFGHFDGPAFADRGKVLLVLAEEDREEAHRRVFDVCEALGLDSDDRARVEQHLVVLGLRGLACAMLAGDEVAVTETAELLELRRALKGDGPWMLVALDPSARLAGIDAESSNLLATRWVQAAESLCKAPGNPTVLVLGHSSKAARTMGKADARGVTGQEDAFRWAGTLNGKGDLVEFVQAKSNYSRPMAEPLVLHRLAGGILRAQTDVEREAKVQAVTAEVDSDVAKACAALTALGGTATRTAIARRAGGRKTDLLAAVDIALSTGLMVPSGTARQPTCSLPGVCVSPPHTPREPGTGVPGVAGTPVPAVPERFREPRFREPREPREPRFPREPAAMTNGHARNGDVAMLADGASESSVLERAPGVPGTVEESPHQNGSNGHEQTAAIADLLHERIFGGTP